MPSVLARTTNSFYQFIFRHITHCIRADGATKVVIMICTTDNLRSPAGTDQEVTGNLGVVVCWICTASECPPHLNTIWVHHVESHFFPAAQNMTTFWLHAQAWAGSYLYTMEPQLPPGSVSLSTISDSRIFIEQELQKGTRIQSGLTIKTKNALRKLLELWTTQQFWN